MKYAVFSYLAGKSFQSIIISKPFSHFQEGVRRSLAQGPRATEGLGSGAENELLPASQSTVTGNDLSGQRQAHEHRKWRSWTTVPWTVPETRKRGSLLLWHAF